MGIDIILMFSHPENAWSPILSRVSGKIISFKLLQFANGAIYDEDRNVYEVHDIKLEALKEIIDDANGKPAVFRIKPMQSTHLLMKTIF